MMQASQGSQLFSANYIQLITSYMYAKIKTMMQASQGSQLFNYI
jgi:hypothetical protein